MRAVALALALLATACGRSEPRWYAELLDGASPGELEELRAQTPYTSIVLEDLQTYLFDSKRIELHVDGRALRTGAEGDLQGQVSPFDYARLCLLVHRSGLSSMEPRYAGSIFHAIETTITVHTTDGGVIAVSDYAKSGPLELWSLHESIRGVASRIDWEPLEASPSPR